MGWQTNRCPQCGSESFYASSGEVPGDLTEEEGAVERRHILIMGSAALVATLLGIWWWTWATAPRFLGTWRQTSPHLWFVKPLPEGQPHVLSVTSVVLTMEPGQKGALTLDISAPERRRLAIPFEWREALPNRRTAPFRPERRQGVYFTLFPERIRTPPAIKSSLMEVFSVGWDTANGEKTLLLNNGDQTVSFTRIDSSRGR